MSDNCPVAAIYPEVNIANHLTCIRLANLGPADPREPNHIFWNDKMIKWKVKEGVARTRLCYNCEEYDASPEVLDCLANGAGGSVKASDVNPTWADIDGMPSGNCLRWNITCSALRTCDDWEPILEDGEEDMMESE